MDAQATLTKLEEELVLLSRQRGLLLQRLTLLDDDIAVKRRLAAALPETVEEPVQPLLLRSGGIIQAIMERSFGEPDGMTTMEISAMVALRLGGAVHPQSHYAALRRLAAEGRTCKRGRRGYALPHPVQESEPVGVNDELRARLDPADVKRPVNDIKILKRPGRHRRT